MRFRKWAPSRESAERIIAQEQASTHENKEETIRNVEVTQEARRQELLREENDEIFGILPVVTADNEDE